MNDFFTMGSDPIVFHANSCIKTGVKSLKWDAARETSDSAAVNARADIKRYNGWKLG